MVGNPRYFVHRAGCRTLRKDTAVFVLSHVAIEDHLDYHVAVSVLDFHLPAVEIYLHHVLVLKILLREDFWDFGAPCRADLSTVVPQPEMASVVEEYTLPDLKWEVRADRLSLVCDFGHFLMVRTTVW
jgi:hypothetical protein